MLSFVYEHYRWNQDDSWGSVGLFFHVLILFCTGCWGSLQMKWLYLNWVDYAKSMENILHTMLPVVVAAALSHSLTSWMGLGELSPYVSSLVLYSGIALFGKTLSSYYRPEKKDDARSEVASRHSVEDEESKYIKKTTSVPEVEYSIPEEGGYLLTYSQLCLPTLIHVWQWCNSSSSSDFGFAGELCALSLVVSTSYILFWMLRYNEITWWGQKATPPLQDWKLPTAIVTTLVSFQYRYLIPISIALSHHFHGRPTQPYWQICLCFNGGLMGLIGTVWLYQKKNSDGGPLFGQNNEDLCMVMTLMSLFLLGCGFPLPFDTLILVAISILSLGMFAITKLVSFPFGCITDYSYPITYYLILSSASLHAQFTVHQCHWSVATPLSTIRIHRI